MKTKDGKNVTVDKLTADNYAVPAGEELLYHCVIEVIQYDPKTGVKISKPRVQKFGKKTFETFVQKTLRKQGYTVNILHNPAGYAEALAKKKAEAEKAKFDAAVAKAVEAALAKKEAEAKAAAEVQAKIDAEAKAKAEAEAAASADNAETPVKEAKKPSKTAKKTKTEE